MDEMNFEDMLKKMIDMKAEKEEAPKKTIDDIPGGKRMMNILGMHTMVKLGKAAQKKMDLVIEELIINLSESRKEGDSSYHGYAEREINKAAKKVAVLQAILTSAAITGMNVISETSCSCHGDEDEEMEKCLDMILDFSML